jgi:hypothetical protein
MPETSRLQLAGAGTVAPYGGDDAGASTSVATGDVVALFIPSYRPAPLRTQPPVQAS